MWGENTKNIGLCWTNLSLIDLYPFNILGDMCDIFLWHSLTCTFISQNHSSTLNCLRKCTCYLYYHIIYWLGTHYLCYFYAKHFCRGGDMWTGSHVCWWGARPQAALVTSLLYILCQLSDKLVLFVIIVYI